MGDTNDKMLVEQIIDTVKQHPVLYDSTVPCRRHLRQAIWEEMADTFDIEVQHLKAKWKNLRDCYTKHIRAQNEDSNAISSLKYWHWSKHLEFLRPHVRQPPNTEFVFSIQTDDDHSTKEQTEKIPNIKLEETDHTNFGSDFDAAESISKQTKTIQGKHSANFGSDSDSLECVIEQPIRKKRRMITKQNVNRENTKCVNSLNIQDMQGFDDIELIFLGYAKTVKKMPLKRQISAKMKIAQIIMEEELKCLE